MLLPPLKSLRCDGEALLWLLVKYGSLGRDRFPILRWLLAYGAPALDHDMMG